MSVGALTAMVVGSMVGAGVFSLPRNFAQSSVERALRERVAVAFGEAGVEFAARRLSGQIHRRSA